MPSITEDSCDRAAIVMPTNIFLPSLTRAAFVMPTNMNTLDALDICTPTDGNYKDLLYIASMINDIEDVVLLDELHERAHT